MVRWQKIFTVGLAAAFVLPSARTQAEDKAMIKGKVVFAGNPDDYKRTKLNTAKDPNCAKSKKAIGSYDVIINKTEPATLRNVLVSVEAGLGDRKYDPPAEPAVLNQLGCEYDPHVFGIMAGQTLKVLNSDDTNHNIHFLPTKNEAYNFTQPQKGMEREVTLVKEDVFKVKCDVHPWMGCHIQVFEHPFFAVTDDTGTFELKGLPAGKYTIRAWHETFGTQTQEVEVATDETKDIDFTYEPGK